MKTKAERQILVFNLLRLFVFDGQMRNLRERVPARRCRGLDGCLESSA